MMKLSLQELGELKEELVKKNLACIVVKSDGTKLEIAGAGIAPAISLLEDGSFADAIVLDKIIGRAAAMLMTLGGVRYVHGVVMSQAAADWLTQKNITFSYDTKVESIINRTGTGMCPMEETVKSLESEKVALMALKKKIKELKANQKIEAGDV